MKIEDWQKIAAGIFHQKNQQYGRDNVQIDDVLARIRDKLARLERHNVAGSDSVRDACLDLSNYAYILHELVSGEWKTGIDRSHAWVIGNIDKPAKQGDVGHDLHAAHGASVAPGHFVRIKTGVRILAPVGVWYSIRGRSSLSWKGLIVIDNVIDTEYTGELWVLMHNVSQETIHINQNDRIAQVVFFQSVVPFCEVVHELPQTDRGDNGWGSTGR